MLHATVVEISPTIDLHRRAHIDMGLEYMEHNVPLVYVDRRTCFGFIYMCATVSVSRFVSLTAF